MRDLLFFARAKKSRQKKALFPDKSILTPKFYRDFSIRHPWRIEKRRASCPPPAGSGKRTVIRCDENQNRQGNELICSNLLRLLAMRYSRTLLFGQAFI
jgi:hypothetical protein